MTRVKYKKTPIPENVDKLEIPSMEPEDKRLKKASADNPILCKVWDTQGVVDFKLVIGINGPYYVAYNGDRQSLYKNAEIIEKSDIYA